MILEQKLLETDLAEVEQVFSKSMEPKCPILKRGSRLNKLWKRMLTIFSLILFVCIVLINFLKGGFSTEAIFYAFVGAVGLLSVTIWKKLENKLTPIDVVKRKYGEPFSVLVKENNLIYKQKDFSYADIRFVVEYKNLLCIKGDGTWLVIKAEEEEKEAVLLKINEKITVHFMREEEPFDMRKLR